jgi:hypothetical protein
MLCSPVTRLPEPGAVKSRVDQFGEKVQRNLQSYPGVPPALAESLCRAGPISRAIQRIAEVGAEAAAFQSEKALSSWVGVCPGDEESAGESPSTRSPKGNLGHSPSTLPNALEDSA